jgi:TIR domain
MSNSRSPVRMFCSYSHEDEKLRKEFETALAPLQREGSLVSWTDHEIIAGEPWSRQILEALRSADIVVLLISPDFIASNYCYYEEMNEALRLADLGVLTVVAVLIRECLWEREPFAHFQMLPRGGSAIDSLKKRDPAWKAVVRGLEKTVRSVQHRKEAERPFESIALPRENNLKTSANSQERTRSSPRAVPPHPGRPSRYDLATAGVVGIVTGAIGRVTFEHHSIDDHPSVTDAGHTPDDHWNSECAVHDHAEHADTVNHTDDHSADAEDSHHN